MASNFFDTANSVRTSASWGFRTLRPAMQMGRMTQSRTPRAPSGAFTPPMKPTRIIPVAAIRPRMMTNSISMPVFFVV